MQQLALADDREVEVGLSTDQTVNGGAPSDDLMARPLTEAKRLAASAFERRYLMQVMARAGGSVSQGARLSGLDRTNFRRLLHRHGLHAALTNVVRL